MHHRHEILISKNLHDIAVSHEYQQQIVQQAWSDDEVENTPVSTDLFIATSIGLVHITAKSSKINVSERPDLIFQKVGVSTNLLVGLAGSLVRIFEIKQKNDKPLDSKPKNVSFTELSTYKIAFKVKNLLVSETSICIICDDRAIFITRNGELVLEKTFLNYTTFSAISSQKTLIGLRNGCIKVLDIGINSESDYNGLSKKPNDMITSITVAKSENQENNYFLKNSYFAANNSGELHLVLQNDVIKADTSSITNSGQSLNFVTNMEQNSGNLITSWSNSEIWVFMVGEFDILPKFNVRTGNSEIDRVFSYPSLTDSSFFVVQGENHVSLYSEVEDISVNRSQKFVKATKTQKIENFDENDDFQQDAQQNSNTTITFDLDRETGVIKYNISSKSLMDYITVEFPGKIEAADSEHSKTVKTVCTRSEKLTQIVFRCNSQTKNLAISVTFFSFKDVNSDTINFSVAQQNGGVDFVQMEVGVMSFYYSDDYGREEVPEAFSGAVLYEIEIQTSNLKTFERFFQERILQHNSVNIDGIYKTVGVGTSFCIENSENGSILMKSWNDVVGIDYILKFLAKNKQKAEEDFGLTYSVENVKNDEVALYKKCLDSVLPVLKKLRYHDVEAYLSKLLQSKISEDNMYVKKYYTDVLKGNSGGYSSVIGSLIQRKCDIHHLKQKIRFFFTVRFIYISWSTEAGLFSIITSSIMHTLLKLTIITLIFTITNARHFIEKNEAKQVLSREKRGIKWRSSNANRECYGRKVCKYEEFAESAENILSEAIVRENHVARFQNAFENFYTECHAGMKAKGKTCKYKKCECNTNMKTFVGDWANVDFNWADPTTTVKPTTVEDQTHEATTLRDTSDCGWFCTTADY